MKYSFIIPYYNRETLDYTLQSFLRQYSNRNDYEIVIIEDSKNVKNQSYHSKLVNILNQFKTLSIQHLQYQERELFNPAILFNYGVKRSLGEILIITNPECYHEVNILKGLDEEFSKDQNIYVVCACQSVNLLDKVVISADGSISIKPINYQFEQWYQHTQYNDRRLHFCTAITKNNFLRIGGFDENYANGVAYDDDDFRNTILERSGLKVIPRDDLIVSHINHCAEYQKIKNWQDLWDLNANYYRKKWNR
jgi:hypothetical protein